MKLPRTVTRPGSSIRSDRELSRQRDQLEKRSGMADAVVRVIQLWKRFGSDGCCGSTKESGEFEGKLRDL
jgi:hypothetical protein